MTAEAGLKDRSRSIQPLSVIGALLGASVAIFSWVLVGDQRLLETPDIPWPLFSAAYFFLERKTVDVHFRGEAHSFSMSDIPTVIGVFYLPPHLLLLAQLVGTIPAFGWSRKLPLLKTLFNSALYLFVAILLIAATRAVPDVGALGPRSWVAVLAALAAISLISSALISLMIARSSGAWPSDWSKGLSVSTLVSLTNGCVGLLAVLALRREPLTLLLFLPPAVVLWLGYRAYTSQQQRQTALAKLNRASQETASRLSAEALSPLVLAHACDLLAAEYAELISLSGEDAQRWTREGDGNELRDDLDASQVALLLQALSGGGISTDSAACRGAMKDYIASRGLREAAAAQFSGDSKGLLLVGNRASGTSARFEQQDIRLLENLADHVAVLLTNARLVEQLQASLEAAEVANEQLVRSIADRDAAEGHRSLLEDRLRQAEKMEAVGRLAGGIAHDFNNLLSIIIGYGELLDKHRDPDGEPLLGTTQILGAAERGSRLVNQLLLFAREGESPVPELLDLNDVLRDMQSLLSMSSPGDVEIDFVLDRAGPKVRMDRGRLDQIVLNLVVNARDAMVTGGTITISTEVRGDPSGDNVCLKIADTGQGMPPEVLERAFEPFFTTKERGSGTGLGLATVYGIVQEVGGKVEVTSTQGEGTTFEILLPLATEEVPAPSDPRGPSVVLGLEDHPAAG